jgi:hypothetical protein
MVYVELRALRGDDWSAGIKAEAYYKGDKRLSHIRRERKTR